MKMYVVRLDPDWDCDYVSVFTNLKDAAEEVYSLLLDAFVWDKDAAEIEQSMWEREESGFYYLFVNPCEDKISTNILVNAVWVD